MWLEDGTREQAGRTVRTVVPPDALAKLRIFVAAPAGEAHDSIAFAVRALDPEGGSDRTEAFFERPER
jgi:hypothetical protein